MLSIIGFLGPSWGMSGELSNIILMATLGLSLKAAIAFYMDRVVGERQGRV
jgi:hypothetical protein